MRRCFRWVWLPFLLCAPACGPAPAPEPEFPIIQPSPEEAAPAAKAVPKGALDRAVLDGVLREGPGWLLERVPVEEVLEQGKFVGWRLRELPAEWEGVELRPGDVVTAVNTMPIETPNDFWAAWTTLCVSSELKIAYRRDAEARELSVPIHGSPDPTLAGKLASAPAPAPPAGQDKRWQTTTIRGEERSLEPTVDWSSEP